MTTFIIAYDGTKLMPTTNVKKVRKLLRTKRAVICKHDPFTIQLQYIISNPIILQPIELKQDAGYQHIGISACSAKHEFVSETRVLLKDEVERHNDCNKYRRTRRNRKRYRKPRFDNRRASKKPGWLPPSIKNKADQHVKLIQKYISVMPVSKIIIEVGQFNTQLLKAIENGLPIPKGTDYQRGERYQYDTLREAVFSRDQHKCVICGKSAIYDKVILNIHHIGYWQKDRSNRLSNLASICTKCHTPKNHQPSGLLYGRPQITKKMASAAFMNNVRSHIVQEVEKSTNMPVDMTYGALTKRTRLMRNIAKTHANDAYCMGNFHPKHRCASKTYEKRRRNNRILEKFYDAKYIDIRDGIKKSGKELGCNRTNRREPRNNVKNERQYRGQHVSKGRRSIRKQRYAVQPGDIVLFDNQKYKVIGAQHYGMYITVIGLTKAINIKKLQLIKHTNAWGLIN